MVTRTIGFFSLAEALVELPAANVLDRPRRLEAAGHQATES
jgi:hypothetical protein